MHLSTNVGTSVTTKKADLPHHRAINKIFSYAEMSDKYRITYDSGKEDASVVHLPTWKQFVHV